jgi:hypothetical protein
MAIDQTEKRRALARQIIQQAPAVMDTLYAMDALRRKRDSGGAGGTPLVFVDADFAGQAGLTHLDAATLNACMAAVPTILSAFASQNFDKAFESVRP